jgi:Uma2 family endonuclease
MSTVIAPPTPIAPAAVVVPTLADLLHELGDVPPERVFWDPIPGTATVEDVTRFVDGADKRLVELVDGTLVEKPMGCYEGRVGLLIGRILDEFVEEHDLGLCFGADATIRFAVRVVRLPDVSFVPWSKMPNRELPPEQVPPLIPDLAVEVLSPSNTRGEMARKRRDYFPAGVRLVWQIDPETHTAEVFTAPEAKTTIAADGMLDGGDVLPGFQLSLARLFQRAGKRRGE